ncbi:unnamed protein product, partial [Hapterophycus canaliculatus]
ATGATDFVGWGPTRAVAVACAGRRTRSVWKAARGSRTGSEVVSRFGVLTRRRILTEPLPGDTEGQFEEKKKNRREYSEGWTGVHEGRGETDRARYTLVK